MRRGQPLFSDVFAERGAPFEALCYEGKAAAIPIGQKKQSGGCSVFTQHPPLGYNAR